MDSAPTRATPGEAGAHYAAGETDWLLSPLETAGGRRGSAAAPPPQLQSRWLGAAATGRLRAGHALGPRHARARFRGAQGSARDPGLKTAADHPLHAGARAEGGAVGESLALACDVSALKGARSGGGWERMARRGVSRGGAGRVGGGARALQAALVKGAGKLKRGNRRVEF